MSNTPVEYWDDKDFVLGKILSNKNWWSKLQFVSPVLRDDENIILAAVNQNGYALKYASSRLQDNEEIVLAAIAKEGMAFEYASDRLREQENILMLAFKQNGNYLAIAGPKWQDDERIVSIAVENNGDSMFFASDRLKDNIDFCIQCAELSKDAIEHFNGKIINLFKQHDYDIPKIKQALALEKDLKEQENKNKALLSKIGKLPVKNQLFKRNLMFH